MSAETGSITAYLDTSALAKWYLNEPGSDAFVAYLQGLDSAAISGLTRAEMRNPEHPRRPSDALHLSIARHLGLETLATADAVKAGAVRAMGFSVDHFCSPTGARLSLFLS